MNKIATILLTIALMTLIITRSTGQITEMGLASYYDDKFEGRITASGQTFSQAKLTAAHRTFPFGTIIKVINLENNLSVEVTINDRGPFVNERVIDLSKAAAKKIGLIANGVVRVKIEVVSLPDTKEVSVDQKTTQNTQEQTKKTIEPQKVDKQIELYEGIDPEYYQIQSKSINPKGFGIQIASYQEAANLIKRCSEISDQINKEVLIQVAGTSDAKVYRIIVGPFETREEAESFNQKLNDFKGSFVIRLDK
jgi:rare lipoprotein A